MIGTEFSRPIKIDHIDKKSQKEIITATAEECALLAKRFDLDSIQSLSAELIIKMTSPLKYHVSGYLKTTLSQISVISGKVFASDYTEQIEAWYKDSPPVIPFENIKKRREIESQDGADEIEFENEENNPEIIQNGEIDLGELTAQFLGLVLPAFPRASDEKEGTGDYIEALPEQTKSNPFAALSALKDKK
jgi:hypothetical protein